jgi:hypothetical protein
MKSTQMESAIHERQRCSMRPLIALTCVDRCLDSSVVRPPKVAVCFDFLRLFDIFRSLF